MTVPSYTEHLLTYDRWHQAEAKVVELERQLEKLKNALRIMGIGPDSVLEK